MAIRRLLRISSVSVLCLGLAGCGGSGGFLSNLNPFDSQSTGSEAPSENVAVNPNPPPESRQSTFADLFANVDDPNVTIEVNRFIWNAALDVLNFLPIESVDPFSGVIVMGYGTPPGGGSSYRATVYVQDPALEARSLRVALASRGGPVSAETQRAVEDAILTRARQLRIANGRL